MNLIELIDYAQDQFSSGKTYQDVWDELFWNMGVDRVIADAIVEAILSAIKEEASK